MMKIPARVFKARAGIVIATAIFLGSVKMHIAAANGRWCGAKRPRSGGNGRPLVVLK